MFLGTETYNALEKGSFNSWIKVIFTPRLTPLESNSHTMPLN